MGILFPILISAANNITSMALMALAIAAPPMAKPPTGPLRVKVMIPLESAAPIDSVLTELTNQFNEGHPKSRIELVKTGTPFQLLREIIAAHYAGDLPDVALINSADLATLMAVGIVQPIPQKWATAKRLISTLSTGQKCRGGPCSLPFQRRVPIWYFNRELLFKHGQNTDTLPSNWARLSPLALKLHKQGELWGVAVPETGESAISRWSAMGLALSDVNPDSSAEWVSKIWTQPAAWLPGNPSSEEATRWFLEQRAVVLLGATDQMPFLRGNCSFRFGTSLPEGELHWFGTDFIVLAKGPTAVVAREFLDFLYKPEVSVRVLRAATTLPVTKDQAESSTWRKEIENWPALKTAMGRKLKPALLEKIAPHVREEYSNIIWEAVEQSPQVEKRTTKLTELKSRLQKILSTNSH